MFSENINTSTCVEPVSPKKTDFISNFSEKIPYHFISDKDTMTSGNIIFENNSISGTIDGWNPEIRNENSIMDTGSAQYSHS